MTEFAPDHAFEGPGGVVTLADLFEGRRQVLLVYHFWFPPDGTPCRGCSMFADQVAPWPINARDTCARRLPARRRSRVPHVRHEGRGVEALGSVWTFLDLTPLGRQEEWEDTPPGRPQTPPYRWWRLHDEYGASVGP